MPVSKTEPTNPAPKKPTSPIKKWAGVTLYVIFVFLVFFIGSVAGWLNTSRLIRNNGGLFGLLSPKNPEDVFHQNSVTVLLLGCDEDRLPGGQVVSRAKARSDLMMLVRMDFDKKTITGISIPRDTKLALPGYTNHKINAYHAYGGNDLSKTAVETLLPGVKIDRVVTLDFDGFIGMVDALGGVDVNVDRNMDYDDKAGNLHIHLKKGLQHLSGDAAEGYVRFRHADSDLVRENRQHEFMIAFKEQLQHHIGALPSVLDQAAKFMADGFNDQEVMSLGQFATRVPKENINLGQLPVKDGPGSFLTPIKKEIPGVLQKYDLVSKPENEGTN